MTSKTVLVINAGSSSIKAGLYDGEQILAETQLNSETPDKLTDDLLAWIEGNTTGRQLDAVGHRIVHGGNKFFKPALLDDNVRAELELLIPLDPDHMPSALKIVDMLKERLPNVPHIACFDTAFFHDLPRVARILPLPREYESIGFRKYGFHGLSYQSVLDALQRDNSIDVDSIRIVVAHLGSGVSLAAIANGMPADTTMAMTPASGVPMSTRSGSLDPGIASYLHETKDVSLEEFNTIVNKASGLLGISETSADMYTLLQQEATDSRSKEAVDVFCYEVKKAIGGLTAVLGGIDMLVFTGGMGENAPKIRARVCAGLDYIGVTLDEELNNGNKGTISTENSPTTVHVVHAEEAFVIAKKINKFLETVNGSNNLT